MIEVSISEFEMRCEELLDQVRLSGQPIRIMDGGVPVAEVVPANPEREE